jgi:predicted amidohydrolase YtcJ
MENHHSHNHSCTHCACNNPILAILKDELFSPENFAALPTVKAVFVKEDEPQTLMISGGTIRPMIDGSVKTVPAIGIADGFIVATGTEEHVYEFMQQYHPGFATRELQPGQTLLPGLIEPHVHIVPTAMLMDWLDVGGFDGQDLRKGYGIPFVSDIIRHEVPNLKPKQWLLGAGIDPALMPLQNNDTELITIDSDLLDNITDAVPVLIISASMHTLYANTPALQEIYNKNEQNSTFKKQYPHFIDYKIETKGQLQEAAGMDPALKTLPPQQKAAMFLNSFKYLKQIFGTANERGVTFMYDAGMNNSLKAVLDAYLLVNEGTVRIGAAQVCNTIEDAKALPAFTPPAKYKDVYISHVKVISDGSNQGLTGYQSEPYLCNPKDNYGIYNFGKEKQPLEAPQEFKDLMKKIIADKGWPVMIHANGNLAIQFAIQMFKEYIPTPVQGVRHRIEHCSLTTQEELKTMKHLQVSPSFLIGHVGYWGYAFEKAIFGDKTVMLDLCNSALKAGMKITLHSDNSVSPLGPLRMMEQSVTRKMEADPKHRVLNAPECITAEQALTAITYDAAWQCYAEQWAGSLKVGHFADFVVLKQDPLTVKDPYMHIRNIEVLETWVGGSQVYAGKVGKEVSMA